MSYDSDFLKVVPVTKSARGTAWFRLSMKGGKAQITLSSLALSLMGENVTHVQLLLSRKQLALRPCDKKEPNARRIQAGKGVPAQELVDVLLMKDGDTFTVPVERIADPATVGGDVPSALFMRRSVHARKEQAA